MKFRGGVALSLALAFSASAIEPGGRLQVLTSFLPLYCFAAQVAGKSADVQNLLPANVSPHEYQFAREDLRKLQKADLVIVNGGGMEGWIERLLQNSGGKKNVTTAMAGLEDELIYGTTPLGGAATRSREKENPNPHVWLDPVLARRMVTNILAALQATDPAHAADYSANASAYIRELENLDREFQLTLAPFQGAPLVTLHDAFPYLARRYGLRLAGVIEQVPDVDPSAKYLQAIERMIQKENIGVLFVERELPSRLANQLSKDLHLKVAELDTLETGSVRKDAYAISMRRNLKALAQNLTSSSHALESKKE